MSQALRHSPEKYGLELDADGWVPVARLLSALRSVRDDWKTLEAADFQRVIDSSDKQRFELNGDRIRALYGHSVKERIEKIPLTPPQILYHGTSPKVVETILAEGLKPMKRQLVHMSTDKETAMMVGGRKGGKPTLFVVHAQIAHAAGVLFYEGNESTWLVDLVPGEFLEVLDDESDC